MMVIILELKKNNNLACHINAGICLLKKVCFWQRLKRKTPSQTAIFFQLTCIKVLYSTLH